MIFLLINCICMFILGYVMTLEAKFPDSKLQVYVFCTSAIILFSFLFALHRNSKLIRINIFFQTLFREKELNNNLYKGLPWLFTIIFLISAILNLSKRLDIINNFPVLAYYADMIPLINKALDRFISGHNPYGIYELPWKIPLTFLPLLWLSYLPYKLLCLDLRYNGLVSIYILYFVFYLMAMKELRRGKTIINLINAGIILYSGWLFISFSRMMSFTNIAHTPPLWCMLTIFLFVFFNYENLILHALLYGALLCIRPTMWVFLPILAIYHLKMYNFKKMLIFLAFSLGLFAVIISPFFISSPSDFINGTFRHYNKMGNWVWGFSKNSIENTFGFTGFLFHNNMQKYASAISIVFQSIIIIISFFRMKNKLDCLIFMSFALLFFSFFAPVPWIYIYFTCMLMFVFCTIMILREQSGSEHAEENSAAKNRKSGRIISSVVCLIGLVSLFVIIVSYQGKTRINLVSPENATHFHKGWNSLENIDIPKGNNANVIAINKSSADISLPLGKPKSRTLVLSLFSKTQNNIEVYVNNNFVGSINCAQETFYPKLKVEIPKTTLIRGNNVITFHSNGIIPQTVYFNLIMAK